MLPLTHDFAIGTRSGGDIESVVDVLTNKFDRAIAQHKLNSTRVVAACRFDIHRGHGSVLVTGNFRIWRHDCVEPWPPMDTSGAKETSGLVVVAVLRSSGCTGFAVRVIRLNILDICRRATVAPAVTSANGIR